MGFIEILLQDSFFWLFLLQDSVIKQYILIAETTLK